MAHVTRFSITGLAGRDEEYACSLERNIAVFFGRNGSGKTSLLRILDSAMTGDAASITNVPFTTAEVAIYSDQYGQEFVRRISKQDALLVTQAWQRDPTLLSRTRKVAEGRDALIPWEELTPAPESTKLPTRWRHFFLGISRLYNFAQPQSQQRPQSGPMSEEALNEEFANAITLTWSAYNSLLNSEVRAAQSEGLANILKAVFNPASESDASRNVDSGVAYSRLTSFLNRQNSPKVLPSRAAFETRYQDDLLLRLIVADVDRVEQRVAAATAPRDLLQKVVTSMFAGGKTVDFADDAVRVRAKDGAQLQIGALSSGEKQVLRLLIEVLRVQESALLVDEPELSMHVDWQRSLVETMRTLNPQAQLILATHSPEIMADLDDAVIYRL